MTTASVVLVPGLWMPRAEMAPLRRRLDRLFGLPGRCFGYRSVREGLAGNARRLAACIDDAGTDVVHVVGHSLGGVLALHALTAVPSLPPGRIVCLGSPLAGSRVAASLQRHAPGRRILGRTIVECVLDRPASEWGAEVAARREIGVIAGTRPMGFGRFLAHFDGDNDGTVAVSETRLPGAADHLLLPVTHTAMVFNPDVARQTAAFLHHGRFDRKIAPP